MSFYRKNLLSRIRDMQLGKAGRIGICWGAIVIGGVYAFILSKRSIEQKRYDHMKIRERMRNSNFGEYPESSRKFSS